MGYTYLESIEVGMCERDFDWHERALSKTCKREERAEQEFHFYTNNMTTAAAMSSIHIAHATTRSGSDTSLNVAQE